MELYIYGLHIQYMYSCCSHARGGFPFLTENPREYDESGAIPQAAPDAVPMRSERDLCDFYRKRDVRARSCLSAAQHGSRRQQMPTNIGGC